VDQASISTLDFSHLQSLQSRAKTDPQGALKDAAKEFEAQFLQMMLKAMRDTVPDGGLTQSNEGRMYQELLDQQWAQQLAGHGVGLADMLVEQLGPSLASSAQATDATADRLDR
jgi:flagellar protein FlgJ